MSGTLIILNEQHVYLIYRFNIGASSSLTVSLSPSMYRLLAIHVANTLRIDAWVDREETWIDRNSHCGKIVHYFFHFPWKSSSVAYVFLESNRNKILQFFQFTLSFCSGFPASAFTETGEQTYLPCATVCQLSYLVIKKKGHRKLCCPVHVEPLLNAGKRLKLLHTHTADIATALNTRGCGGISTPHRPRLLASPPTPHWNSRQWCLPTISETVDGIHLQRCDQYLELEGWTRWELLTVLAEQLLCQGLALNNVK